MKEELIIIEDGEIEVRGNPIFTDLNLQLYKSEILGVVFDNVIARKCLLELFRGERRLNGGRVFIGNKRQDYDNVLSFFRDNATIIEKNSKLISNLTIEENIFLFADNSGIVSERKYKNNFQVLVNKFGLDIHINRQVQTLLPKERIIIELLKAYYEEKKLVVLNYISGQLLNNDLEDIHSLIVNLTKHGMSFILIESFNNIVFEWVNSFFLIQHGKTVGIFDSNSYNNRQLYSLLLRNTSPIAGALINNKSQEKKLSDTPVLEIRNVYTDHIKALSMQIRAGDILKIIYMDDDSYEHITDLLKGNMKPISGEIRLRGRNITINSTSNAFDKGICFIEESPYENMLFYNMTVKENLGLALSEKIPLFWLKRRYIKSLDHLIKTFKLEEFADIKLRKLDPRILQVIAYLKWYLYAPDVVICTKPFTELDINLQEITIEMIQYLKSRGISVILLTPILSETYKVENDTIYIKDGRIIDKNEVYMNLYKR